jgi:hypothetical protein
MPFVKVGEKKGGPSERKKKMAVKNIMRYVLPCDTHTFIIFRITDILMDMPMFYLQKHNLHAIKILKCKTLGYLKLRKYS